MPAQPTKASIPANPAGATSSAGFDQRLGGVFFPLTGAAVG